MIGAVRETHVNGSKGYHIGAETYELSGDKTSGELFRFFQREYGRCISKVYFGDLARVAGWVFQRRKTYEDDPTQTYLHEVWIELLEKPDTTVTTSYPVFIDGEE